MKRRCSLPRILPLLLCLLPFSGRVSSAPDEAPAEPPLLALAVRSPLERAGDLDALARSCLEAVAAGGRAPGAAAPKNTAPEETAAAESARAAGEIPQECLLALLLRRVVDLRPSLADPGALIPAAEAALARRYPGRSVRQTLRSLLDLLYRGAGREEDRRRLQKESGFLTRWAIAGPFGLPGPSQFRRPFPPEEGIDPAARYSTRKGSFGWWIPPRSQPAEPRIFPARWIYPHRGVVYLLSQFRAARECDAVLHLASNEALAVWVNDRPAAVESLESPVRERRAFELRLPAGASRILIKLHCDSDSWLWGRLSGADGEPLSEVDLEIPIADGSGKGPDGLDLLRLYPVGGNGPLDGKGSPVRGGPTDTAAVSLWEKCLAGLQIAKAPAPLLADARLGFALLLDSLGEDEEAVSQAEEALQLRGDDPVVQYHAGNILLAAGYLPRDHARSRARAAFEAVVRLDPGFLPAEIPLSQLLREDNEPVKAAGRLREARPRGPAFFALSRELLTLYEKEGWEAEASELIVEIEAQAPRATAPHFHRAGWYQARGNTARALAEYRGALERDRSASGALSEIAELAAHAGDDRAAREALELQLAQRPEDPDAKESLASFLGEHGEKERALRLLEELRDQCPADPDSWKRLGEFQEEAGQAAGALAAYRMALEREPGDIQLRRHVDRLQEKAENVFYQPFDETLEDWLPRVPAAEELAGANGVAILDLAVVRYFPDGSSTEYTHQAFRVLSEEAKEELAHAPTPGEVIRLRTVTARGTTLEPVPATGKSMYVLPAVEPGATVEWAYRVDHSRFDGPTIRGQSFFFQDTEFRKPFLLSRYVVILPEGFDLDLVERNLDRSLPGAAGRGDGDRRARAANEAKPAVKKETRMLPWGYRAVIYEARDMPRLQREIGMPFKEDYFPSVELIQKASWDDVASQFEDGFLQSSRATPELRREAAQATAGLSDPMAKARALYAHVNAIIPDGPGPSSALPVFIAKRGDRTVLYKSLLEASGVACRWALASPRECYQPRDDGSHPRPERFQERFVCLEPEAKAPLLISLSTRRAPFGKLPYSLQGGMAMVLDPEGGGRFLAIPSEAVDEQAGSTRVELTFSVEASAPAAEKIPELGARGTVEIESRALEGRGQKERFRTIKDDLKRQVFSGTAARLFPGAKVIKGEILGLADPDAPFAIRLEVSAPKVLVARGEREALFHPVIQPLEMVKRLIQKPQREHPYRFGRELIIRDRVRIATGPALRIARLPRGLTQTCRLGTYTLALRADGPDGRGGEAVTITREATFLPATLSSEEFPALVEFARALDRAEEERIVLEKR